MTFGIVLAFFLPNGSAVILGALVLVVVGLWIILQQYFLNLWDCLIINILKEPVQADLNKSGEIDLKEAFFLGFALAMDALGAGLGAAMSGYSLFWTSLLVGATEFIMINSGIIVGQRLQIDRLKKTATILPGGIIIILGLTKLFSS